MTANAQLVAGAALGFVVVMGLHSCAHAEPPVPRSEWTDEARLVLAQAILVEGGGQIDAHAIPFVLARRWKAQRRGWSWAAQIRRYSRPLALGPRTPRQHRILSASWHQLPRRVRNIVLRFEAGVLRDPCPLAAGWGSRAFFNPPPHLRVCHGASNVFVRRVAR